MFKAAACGLVCAVALQATVALADTTGVRIVTRDSVTSGVRVYRHRPYPSPVRSTIDYRGAERTQKGHPQTFVIDRPVVAPAATVSRALHEQPVWPHLAEVFIFGEGQSQTSTIYLDPDVDYQNQGMLELDENHFINRAQRMVRRLRAVGPRIVTNPNATQPVPSSQGAVPHMIFEMPDNGATPTPQVPTERIVRKD